MPNKRYVSKVIQSVVSPIREFLHIEASGGLVLLAVTLIALYWANSAFHASYFRLLEMPIGISVGSFAIYKSFEHWVNDGLMVIFFFVVGLEIKKEFVMGELADRKSAALPLFAALGGMVLPAGIYALFNHDQPTAGGWGIPMATDIAFAVGVLTLLGNRVPFALKVFLLALAIVDDLGAVLVIAFFYTSNISFFALAMAVAISTFIYLLNVGGVRSRLVYVLLGIVMWFAVYKSGVHATIAGVILGLLTPVRSLVDRAQWQSAGFELLKKGHDENVTELSKITYETLSPANSLIHTLHPWVTFFIMPLFALCNAGVRIQDFEWSTFFSAPVSLGIIAGLVIGKPFGIFGFSWLSCRLGIAQKSSSVSWIQLFGVAALGGIGFTMALFIAHLSLNDAGTLDFAKLAIMVASTVSALLGAFILVIKRA